MAWNPVMLKPAVLPANLHETEPPVTKEMEATAMSAILLVRKACVVLPLFPIARTGCYAMAQNPVSLDRDV